MIGFIIWGARIVIASEIRRVVRRAAELGTALSGAIAGCGCVDDNAAACGLTHDSAAEPCSCLCHDRLARRGTGGVG